VRSQIIRNLWKDQVLNEDQTRELLLFEGMLGRCLLPLNTFERWETMLHVVGVGQSGKSSVFDVLEAIIGPRFDGKLSDASRSGNFQLQQFMDRRLVIIRDAPSHIKDLMPETLLTQLISGESITAGKMYDGNSMDGVWDKNLITGGNGVLVTFDNAGDRMRRRIFNFPFQFLVGDADFISNMSAKILRDELMWVFVRLAQQYATLRAAVGDGRLRTVYTQRLIDFQEETAEESNPVLDFIKNGSEVYQMVSDPNAFTLLQDLQQFWKDHSTNVLGDRFMPFKADEALFRQAGNYGYVLMQVCRVGGTTHKAGKKECGDHYDAKVRRNVRIVTGLRVIVNHPSSMPAAVPTSTGGWVIESGDSDDSDDEPPAKRRKTEK